MDLISIGPKLLPKSLVLQEVHNENTLAKADESELLLPLEITSRILSFLPIPTNIHKARLISRGHKELVEKK